MTAIQSFFKRIQAWFALDSYDHERRRLEAYLSEATSQADLEARQRAWDQKQRPLSFS